MERNLDLVICVVSGPGSSQYLGVIDIIESARCYVSGRYRVVVVDNSGGYLLWKKLRKYQEVDYLRNWLPNGVKGLTRNLQRAYLHALESYSFPALLRMDTDALITGPGLIMDIHSYIGAHPEAGMLGSYRMACTGAIRDFSPIANQILRKRNWSYLKEIVEKARKYGYETGEHAQGGAYILSYSCLMDMRSAGYLNLRMGGPYVPEDGIFSLFVRALGYTIDDFAAEGPFAIAWQGLPIPKEEIVRQGKKVIHSVKFSPEDLQIRDYFRKLRTGGAYS